LRREGHAPWKAAVGRFRSVLWAIEKSIAGADTGSRGTSRLDRLIDGPATFAQKLMTRSNQLLVGCPTA
jgi:hypothetical protein